MTSFVKSFGVTIDYALYEVSYANIILYMATLPTYNGKGKDGKGQQEHIDADDPANKDRIEKLLFG